MIRMIVEVFYDIYAFTIVLALTILAFGNSLYILALNAMNVQIEQMVDDSTATTPVELYGENQLAYCTGLLIQYCIRVSGLSLCGSIR